MPSLWSWEGRKEASRGPITKSPTTVKPLRGFYAPGLTKSTRAFTVLRFAILAMRTTLTQRLTASVTVATNGPNPRESKKFNAHSSDAMSYVDNNLNVMDDQLQANIAHCGWINIGIRPIALPCHARPQLRARLSLSVRSLSIRLAVL